MPWIVATIIVLLCCIQIHSFRLAQNQILVRRLGWEHFGSSFYRLARLDDVMDGVNLSVLVNVSSDAIHLRRKIAAWLDKEYIPQDIHQKLGRHVETEYCAIRKEGILDLGELLMRMGTALEKVDMEDAFVNAWDVANKASELLIDRLNAATNQGTLTKRVSDLNLTKEYVENTIRELQSEFSRYKLLKDYLDGDVPYKTVYIALALQLGFRLPERAMHETGISAPNYVVLQQYQELAPLGWENLAAVPDVSTLEDSAVAAKMLADLPDEEASSDLIIESMLGLEYYNRLKAENDPTIMRRVLVTKWMYILGFLNDVFPPAERFVPFHRVNAEE